MDVVLSERTEGLTSRAEEAVLEEEVTYYPV